MVAKKTSNTELDDAKMAVKVELKRKVDETQKRLVAAIGDDYAFHTRQVDALCTDIEAYMRIINALNEVKL